MSRRRTERALQARRQAEVRARQQAAAQRAEQAEARSRTLLTWLSAGVMLIVVAWVMVTLRPAMWFAETTPTGGDLGAHVWAPAYLRDVLLSEFRLTGWSHDWYAGFPAFVFYMVAPFVIVVIVNVGTGLSVSLLAHVAAVGAALAVLRIAAVKNFWATLSAAVRVLLVAVLAGLGVVVVQLLALAASDVKVLWYQPLAVMLLPAVAAFWSWVALRNRPRLRLLAAVSAALVALLIVPVPYGVALKFVSIIGVVLLPVTVWVMARMAGVAPFGQALAVGASLLFLFDRSYNIYGGNLMSTMAGEFAFSLGLAGAVLYIGVAAQGLRTGNNRVLAGVLLALTGLLHLFTAFFALAATVALVVVAPWNTPAWLQRLKWTVVTGALAAALSSWWVLPFWWNRSLLNDMGWGKDERYVSALWSRSEGDYGFLTNDPKLQPFVVIALLSVVGFVVAALWRAESQQRSARSRSRRSRQVARSQGQILSTSGAFALALALTGLMAALVFRYLPEGRLWNVRILPFYYLCVYLVAAVGLSEALRWCARWIDRGRLAWSLRGTEGSARPSLGGMVSSGLVVILVGFVIVLLGLPLRSLPFGSVQADGKYHWGPFSTAQINLGPHWLQYNYEGYELRGSGYEEYSALIDLMTEVGETHGCGPALWEYSSDRLGSYGTPMAPMLLPHWTDRCIGSMEGLYFEASATTPYHFMMQSELSEGPSRAQRDLPYEDLNVALGVEHLQMMGVRYYLASSGAAVSQAFATPGLTEVAVSEPWAVFKVEDSEPVTGLDRLPVVLEGMGMAEDSWLVPSVAAFMAGHDGPILAADGPSSWPRLSLDTVMEMADLGVEADPDGEELRADEIRRVSPALVEAAPVQTLEPAVVSDVVRDNHSMSFSVDRIGSPVLVRTSYFPNWSVSGADGPYRVTPNLMVVVPTSTEVQMTYGRTFVDWLATVLTLTGVVAAFWLHFRRPDTSVSSSSGLGWRTGVVNFWSRLRRSDRTVSVTDSQLSNEPE